MTSVPRRARLAMTAAAALCAWLPLPSGAFAQTSLPPPAPNVVPLTMRTPLLGFNRMVVSLTVCRPGTVDCIDVDNVMVDTGSTGLRLEAAALPSSFRPPTRLGPDGRAVAECLYFVADTAWGGLFRVDLHLGGLTAENLPVQIIDGGAPTRPRECPPSDTRPTSNGTLGIGPQATDCGGTCEQSTAFPTYFSCADGTCAPVRGGVGEADRLPNPVAGFALHDNGIVIDFPPAPPSGAAAVRGTLTIGVGEPSGAAHILKLGPTGRFTTLYGGRAFRESYIDSGTTTDIVPDDTLRRCEGLAWAFCVQPALTLDAVMVGRDGVRIGMPFRVGDYRDLRERRIGASDAMAVAAEASSQAFVWGAPFFLGKRIFVVIDGKAVPGAAGLVGPLYGIASSTPVP